MRLSPGAMGLALNHLFFLCDLPCHAIFPTSSNAGGRTTKGQNQHLSSHRALIGLCIFDILSSTTLFLEPFGHWTCTVGGFFKVMGITCGSFCNCGLSNFFVGVICREWKDAFTVSCFEWPLHSIMGAVVICWIVGIPLQVCNPTSLGCWTVAYPEGCATAASWKTTAPACVRGDPWGWICDTSTTIGFLIAVLILLSTNLAIFTKV